MIEQLKVGTYPNNYGGSKLQDVVIVVNSLFASIAAITRLAPENLDTLKEIADNFANYLTKTEAQNTYLAKTNAQSTYLAKTDLVNDLTTGGTNKALTAEQGKALNTSLSNKIDKTTTASASTLGLVKQGVAVTDAAGGDEKDKINALLASLRTAGVIASA